MTNNQDARHIGAVAASLVTLGTAGLAAIAGTFAWSAPWPWSVGAGAVAVVSAVWTAAGTVAIARLLVTAGPSAPALPEEEPEAEPEPDRPRWEVMPAKGFEVDLISELQPQTETLLIQAQVTLTAADPLTSLDLAWVLWKCYTESPARRCLVGHKLPSGRKLRRGRYDETIDLLVRAGIIVDRTDGYAGTWAPGLTLSQGLQAIDIDPESLPVLTWQPGSTRPGLARPGTLGTFLPTKVVVSGD